MSKSQRRPQQIFSIVMWLVSLIFAACLMGLGALIIKDLPQVDKIITVEQFLDTRSLESLEKELETALTKRQTLARAYEDANQALESTQSDYQSKRVSFDNWIRTRNATQSSDQNPEVIERTRALEALKIKERAALRVAEDIQTNMTQVQRQTSDIRTQMSTIRAAARPAYEAAKRAQALRVFLYRLALTLPLLLIAGWMIAKKRGSAYWPLYRGFSLFALFAFFVELVPYLPSYGGYVRYSVGLIVILISGHFIIRAMRQYIERKQMEEARSESERRQSIEYETALKKIAAKTCPGCDRSIVQNEGVNTDFCVHCGIRLQRNCGSCGSRNVSFHKFCLSCGVPSPESLEVDALESGPPKTA